MNNYEVFEADSTDIFRCHCGCGTLKVGLYDEDGNLRAMFGFTPEDWTPVIQGILDECEKMVEEANVQ